MKSFSINPKYFNCSGIGIPKLIMKILRDNISCKNTISVINYSNPHSVPEIIAAITTVFPIFLTMTQ